MSFIEWMNDKTLLEKGGNVVHRVLHLKKQISHFFKIY
jgi:hypothetical protein